MGQTSQYSCAALEDEAHALRAALAAEDFAAAPTAVRSARGLALGALSAAAAGLVAVAALGELLDARLPSVLAPLDPLRVAVLLYLQMAVFGAVLISGFWSVCSFFLLPLLLSG